MNASWSTDLSREIYAIEHWGEGYFDINHKGHVVVYPAGSAKNGTVDLVEIVDSVRKEGLALPVLVRFKDILRDRIGRLTDAFNTAKEEFEYLGNYTPSIRSRSISNVASSKASSVMTVTRLGWRQVANQNYWLFWPSPRPESSSVTATRIAPISAWH